MRGPTVLDSGPGSTRRSRLHSEAEERVLNELPTGTVTFLFTDVEGSTKLVRELGPAYAPVLTEHRRVVRGAVEGAGGRVIDARGDEIFSVFTSAGSALRAAMDAQRRLHAHEGPEAIDLRVRIGLHTGEGVVADDDYVGLDVHRAARVCAAGHGGQVLLSGATRAALADDEPEDELLDLGEHRLKGLPQPERIFQASVPGLPREFPALRRDGTRPGAATKDPEGRPLRVVLAEDAVLLREGVARLLEEAGFAVVGQSGTAEDLMLKVRSYRPDVAVVDIRMPPTQTDEGLRAAQEIREHHPGVGVLVLSQFVEPGYAMELLSGSAEGVGYLLKDRVSDLDGFADAVRRVAEGGSALDPDVVSQLVGRRRGHDPLDDLTPREREVLELMAQGRSNSAVAERLYVTERAVEKHVTSIFGKLGLPAAGEDHRRVLAVLAYLQA